MAKINPRRRPTTQEDVDRAWKSGVLYGIRNAHVIFLTVLVDKFNGADYIGDVWTEINKLSEELKEGRLSIADLRTVLKEEYKIDI